jgi:hypothetical protein
MRCIFEAHRRWRGLELGRRARVGSTRASAGHDDVAAQSNGIDERLIAGGMPASDQVSHDRSPGRLIGFREHMQVRRGMVSGALPLGMCCQEVCESLGFADTNRDPAIATAVAPREDINPAVIPNRFFEWMRYERIYDARLPGPHDRVTHARPL